MKPQFDHKLSTSFCLFIENNLLQKGEAFQNTTGTLYKSDSNINGLEFSNSPYQQWVFDSSVSGAIIPTGVYLDSVFVGRGTSGVALDFMGGGAYHANKHDVSGAFAKKDFNFYFKTEEDTELFLETAYTTKDPLNFLTGSNNFKINAPCVIVNQKDSKNEPFSFGGQDETESFFQATIIADKDYLVDGARSIFRDLNEECFPVIDFADTPFNSMGDLKTGHWAYNELYSRYSNPSQNATIDRVLTNKVKQSSAGRGNFHLGYCEFRLLNYRYPRI